MKKTLSNICLIFITAVIILSVCSCQSKEASFTVIKETDTYIVISIPEEQAKDMLLIDYMQSLKDEGSLDFVVTNGMITSINNIENAADFSSCWMLYTSDKDNSSTAWGSVEYNDIECGSSVLGAESLKVCPGELYIWVYKSF